MIDPIILGLNWIHLRLFWGCYNLGKTIISHPFGNGLYQLFIISEIGDCLVY